MRKLKPNYEPDNRPVLTGSKIFELVGPEVDRSKLEFSITINPEAERKIDELIKKIDRLIEIKNEK